jgi:hypothetical protein
VIHAAILLAALAKPQPVSWATVRAAIAEEICVVRYPGEDYGPSIGNRAACGAAPAATEVEEAVDSALASAMPLLVEPKGLTEAYAENDEAKRNRMARETYLNDAAFLRTVVPRITAELAKVDLTCTDCPKFEPSPRRVVTWAELSKYVTAYFWPDPVSTPIDAEGKPTGRPRYAFHICSGLNAASQIENPDPALLRVGFVVAMSSPTMKQRAGNHFMKILGEAGFQALTSDDARTRYLRDHLAPMLAADAGVEADTCTALEAYGADLGLRLAGCQRD